MGLVGDGSSRVADLCYHRRRAVVAGWVVVLVATIGLGLTAGGGFTDVFELPGSETDRAEELLAAGGFGSRMGFRGQLVVHAPTGDVETPETIAAIDDLVVRIEAEVDGSTATSPYGPDAFGSVSGSGRVAVVELAVAEGSEPELDAAAERIAALVADADVPDGIVLELAGDRFAQPVEGGSEGAGLLAAVVILLVVFGSVVAMSLPIVTALFGVATGVGVVLLLARVITMPSFTIQLVLMVGLGVGIDYALLIVTRYRELLATGHPPSEAVVIAMATAGRSVVFAGITVVISVLGLVVVGLSINRALGTAMAVGVATTMVAALTLLPAALGFVGTNIDRLRLPLRAGRSRGTIWRRWARRIQRRPGASALVAGIGLAVLALPATSMRLGFTDAGSLRTDDTTRRAYDLLADEFGPGVNGPLLLAVQLTGPTSAVALEALIEQLVELDGVASVDPPLVNDEATVALVQLTPTTGPQDPATTDLVDRLRRDVIPDAEAGGGLVVLVGGAQAAVVDFAEFNAARLPVFIGVVLALSFVVLVVVFRSILVPLKAVVMNLLSVGAAYGVLVAVFQWGVGLGVLGGSTAPIEAWVPIMLFAIVFGLSMDYEVFLLSRIREEYDRTGDNSRAVADGLIATGRVISAAAAVMVVVFGGFVLSADRSLQMFGLGLATAIAVDATIVRLVFVPAAMELLGDRNWWLPSWMAKPVR